MNYLKNSDDTFVKAYFILGYRVSNGIIYIYYANRTESVGYSKEKEKELLYQMKKQVLDAYENIDKYKINKKLNLIFYYYSLMFSLFNIFISIKSNLKVFNLSIAGIFLLLAKSTHYSIEKDKDYVDEVNKYIYFLNNEKEINSEILKRYIDDNENSIYFDIDDAPVITINDIHDTSIKELKETVELIRRNKNNSLN